MTGATLSDAPPGFVARHKRALIVLGVVALIAIGAVVVIALALYGATQQDNAAYQAQEATSVDIATLPQTIPFESVAGHVVVDASPDDSVEALAFMLDSGAPVLYATDVATRFGGEVAGQISTAAVDGTVQKSDVVPVETLALGDAVFHDVAGVVGWVDQDNPLSCVTEAGLLGASLMRNAVWQIDYQAGEVTISPSVDGLDHVDDALAFDFTSPTPNSPSPVMELAVGGGSVTFLLDTGSDGGLTVHPADLEAVGVTTDDSSPAIQLLGAGAAGTFTTELAWATAPLGLGEVVVDYPIASTEMIAEGQGNIGNGFLQEFVVTIDWPESRIYLDPVSADGGITQPAAPASAGIGWDGEHITIGSVVKGGAAAEAGLEPGMVVASIDGTSYENATRDDFCALLTATPPAAGAPTSTTLVTDDGTSHVIEVVVGFYD